MNITYISILLGLLLLAIPAYLVFTYDRLSCRKSALAVVRMLVQLSVMGGLLFLVYRCDSFWLSLLWLLLLVVAAAFMLVSRARLRSRVLFFPACAGMFCSVLAVSAYVIFAVFRPEAPLSVRWWVPVTGVLMAHVLTTNIHAVRTYFDCLRQDSQAYFTLLGNGAPRRQALAPYIARALKSLTVPAAASLSAMGLFVLPMLLSGLLLGGLKPVEAVFVFVVLVFASLLASAASLFLTIWLSDRRAFTHEGRLANVFTAD